VTLYLEAVVTVFSDSQMVAHFVCCCGARSATST
jgi:hypothetical protein